MIREIVSALLLVSVIAEDMFPNPTKLPGKCPTPTNVVTSADNMKMDMIVYEQYISKEYVEGKDCKCVKKTVSKGADGVLSVKKEGIKDGKPVSVDMLLKPVKGEDGWFTQEITAMSMAAKMPTPPEWVTKMKTALLKTDNKGVFVGWGCSEMGDGHIELITICTTENKNLAESDLKMVKDGLKGFTEKDMVMYEQYISKEYIEGMDVTCAKKTISLGEDGVISVKKEAVRDGNPVTIDVLLKPVEGEAGWYTHEIKSMSMVDEMPTPPEWVTKMKTALLKTDTEGVFVVWGCAEMEDGHIEFLAIQTESNENLSDSDLEMAKDGVKGFTENVDLQHMPVCP